MPVYLMKNERQRTSFPRQGAKALLMDGIPEYIKDTELYYIRYEFLRKEVRMDGNKKNNQRNGWSWFTGT